MNIEQIAAEYQSALRAFLLSRVKNPADADDLLQEVLSKTFQNLHTLSSNDKIKPWLFQIAQNALTDHYRRIKRDRTATADGLWYAESAESTAHPFESCVHPFLAALPEETRDLLRAIELEGVSQKDYAAQKNINYSTLKYQVKLARAQLRSLFDECCVVTLSKNGTVIDFQRKSSCRTGC